MDFTNCLVRSLWRIQSKMAKGTWCSYPIPILNTIFFLIVTLLSFLPSTLALGPGEIPEISLEIYMKGAVFNTPSPLPNSPTLILDIEKTAYGWERIWGIARDFNLAFHHGSVQKATVTDQNISLSLTMTIVGDTWVQGGPAEYQLQLQRSTNGKINGHYTGLFRGIKCQGEVTGYEKPRPSLSPNYTPVRPLEHPRILFRRSDLPRLKERLQTPLGQAAWRKMGHPQACEGDGDAIGMGIKFQLTQDRSYANQAMDSVTRHMANESGGALAVGRAWGPRLEQVAVAYDLCYEVWPSDFKKKVEDYLRLKTLYVYFDQRKLGTAINWNVGSNYAGPIYAGAAFAGLALWGERGPQPVSPQPPFVEVDLPPLPFEELEEGVPVCIFQPGISPSQWLVSTPLPFLITTDPMISMLGLEEAHPTVGKTYTIEGHVITFSPIPPEQIPLDGKGIRLAKVFQKALTQFFYTILKVQQDGLYKVEAPFSRVGRLQVVLNGKRLAHGQVVRLQPGYYRMMVGLRLGVLWGTIQPSFLPAQEQDIERSKQLNVDRLQEYEMLKKEWEADYAEWKRWGGADPYFIKLFEMGKRIMYLFAREACGTGGYQCESGLYFIHGIDGPGRYHSAFLSMMGYPLSTRQDISHFIPRLMMNTQFKDGKIWNLNINHELDFRGKLCADMFPLIPTEWQPAVLWAWNLVAGGDPEQPNWEQLTVDAPISTFLYYPFHLKPIHPSQVMPQTWEAPDYGYYVFRNSWKGDEDIILQVFARTRNYLGWGGPDAGTYRLQGLNQFWVVGNEKREVRRYLESVVLFPDHPEWREDGCGQVTYVQTFPNGSGVISINLSELYFDRNEPKENLPKRERYGNIYHPGKASPKISHLRSIGIDFSGRSGVPAIFVIVDKIIGQSGSKLWVMHVQDLAGIQIQGNSFQISRNSANLYAQFILPSPVEIQLMSETKTSKKTAGGGAGKKDIYFPIRAVTALSTQDPECVFFLVGTLQKGNPPTITTKKENTYPTVIVGKQTIRFDGEKVLFSD